MGENTRDTESWDSHKDGLYDTTKRRKWHPKPFGIKDSKHKDEPKPGERREITTENAWDRQPDEPTRWYGRFTTYRDAGSERSLRAIYREYAKQKGAKDADHPPAKWYVKAKEWDWEKRAVAWDDEQRRIKAETDVKARADILARHARLGVALQGLAAQRLNTLGEELRSNPGALMPSEARAYAREGVMMERLAKGMSTESMEMEYHVGGISDKELRELVISAQQRQRELVSGNGHAKSTEVPSNGEAVEFFEEAG